MLKKSIDSNIEFIEVDMNSLETQKTFLFQTKTNMSLIKCVICKTTLEIGTNDKSTQCNFYENNEEKEDMTKDFISIKYGKIDEVPLNKNSKRIASGSKKTPIKKKRKPTKDCVDTELRKESSKLEYIVSNNEDKDILLENALNIPEINDLECDSYLSSDDQFQKINEDDLFAVAEEKAKYIEVDGGYQCEICSKISRSMAGYVSHHESHEERSRICYMCGWITMDAKKLNVHLSYYRAKGKCQFTRSKTDYNARYIKETDLAVAAVRRRLPSNRSCDICHRSFISYIKLMDHLNTHSRARPYSCSCGSTFGCHSNFIIHFKKFKCPIEGRKIPSYAPQSLLGIEAGRKKAEKNRLTATVKVEKRSKNKNRQYICKECNKEFPAAPKLRIHLEQEHMERKFTCQECNRAFAKDRLLRAHIEEFHISKFKCFDCNLIFTKIQLKVHKMQFHKKRSKSNRINIVRDDSTFHCAICNLDCQFKLYKTHLKCSQHKRYETDMKIKLNLEKFTCRLCSNTEFNDLFTYTHHQATYHNWSVRNSLEEFLNTFGKKLNENEMKE